MATAAGQILTAVLAVWYLGHTKTVRLQKGAFRLNGNIVRHTLTLGICSFLSQISLVAAMAAINNMIRRYGALDAVLYSMPVSDILTAIISALIIASTYRELSPGHSIPARQRILN